MSSQEGSCSGPRWTEHETNPPPEVMVHSAPEPVHIPMNVGNNGNNNDISVEPDGDIAVPNDAERAVRLNPESRSHLWNWKTITGTCIGLIILAIVIPVVVTVTATNRDRDGDNIETTAVLSATSSSGPSITPTSYTTVPSPSSTLNPYQITDYLRMQAPECVRTKFIKSVNWIGIDQSMGGWDFNLHPARTAEDCCTICHQSTTDGCNGWLYMPEKSFTPACSIIHGFTGPTKSDSCPNGRPGIVFAKTDDKDSYGGPGPCAGLVRG
ncbi:hypothetical protein CTA2_8018 [Colletotrichum tanaceti]|uniref:Uncharacterized protein n=1 Tax=Colletotrichum tanaceti TaxID=1306861 RepID=A0A4V6DG77_9PEZI|nr:hypothetical protein CTA2_8018 [Colletotrichum tanaceti]TKW51166.1 hypothetical protein CTA1_969 [Colletotrichum tanaceti]